MTRPKNVLESEPGERGYTVYSVRWQLVVSSEFPGFGSLTVRSLISTSCVPECIEPYWVISLDLETAWIRSLKPVKLGPKASVGLYHK